MMFIAKKLQHIHKCQKIPTCSCAAVAGSCSSTTVDQSQVGNRHWLTLQDLHHLLAVPSTTTCEQEKVHSLAPGLWGRDTAPFVLGWLCAVSGYYSGDYSTGQRSAASYSLNFPAPISVPAGKVRASCVYSDLTRCQGPWLPLGQCFG